MLITGRDRQSFLQGQVTNDILSLTPGSGCYAFQCDATGHVLSDMRVLCGENFLLLDIEPGFGCVVQANLEKHLVMERVKIAPYETQNFFLWGENIITELSELSELSKLEEKYGLSNRSDWTEGQHYSTDDFILCATKLVKDFGFTLYTSNTNTTQNVPGWLLPCTELTENILDNYRIEAGIPRYGIDIDAKVLAPETGQALRAIHYKKGCYIGQEIIARLDARGHTNRSFAGFYLTETVPQNTPLFVEGKEIGRITSSCLSPTLGTLIGLGYIRNEFAEPGNKVNISEKEITVTSLPFMPVIRE